ncbi:MAG: bifunctional riboflavin kinase/FMN adenylyltransferase, partial [Anaerovoracaceae bacterium]
MRIFNSLEEICDIESTVVALGNFDGVHRGHQEIIARTVKSAEAVNLKSAVFTFSNHTRTLLKNLPPVKNILYAEEKARIIADLGID